MIFKILTIIGLATFEVYAAIPAGFAFKLSPLVIFLSSTAGGLIGVFAAAYLGSLIQRLLGKYRKTKKEEKPKSGFVLRVWEKYGLIGLGVIGTMTVGGPISIGVGVGFNVPINKLVFYCCIGVIARCAIFTFLGEVGMKLLGH
jgi:membrane protein YqaA with SNARE-associated domain